ncbi:histidine phosphatase family protein [Dietzia sp. PP-33]|jgi:broad specificity phosphatase PhoE|uniref:histidine phosphatase family protein n=1 Tax=Dietzia sp. PP-33 TaxID=2957500 RepID=UPI0029AD6CD7|nr:histidine phosphatase family protein [Dietzia sp. PP-33]MDX2357848.1 histidine phosphatase family protein [Dietzia sp. PP-33]
MSARLHLVRHGQTPSNVAGALDTALPGAPLTELGRTQAETVGDELAGSGISPSVVLCSEAARARETAGLIAEAMGLSTQAVPGMYEVQAGQFEMRTGAEALLAYNRVVRDWLEDGELTACLPGGESAHDVRDRAMPVVSELRESYLDNGTDVVLVVHGTLMRMIAVFAGAVPSQWALDNRIPNCGVIELAPDRGGWSCERWGDHLGRPQF